MSNDAYTRFDTATKNISARALVLDGHPVGRVVMKHGAALRAFVQLWGGSIVEGRATGGNYDRATAAIEAAAQKIAGQEQTRDPIWKDARERFCATIAGMKDGERWESALERAGWIVVNVID